MTKNIDKGMSRLSKFSLLTLFSVYFLILVGGIVRSTGSGMGCPDWPKCFGNWVPPTEVSELPANYQEIYSSKRAAKNLKLANYLDALGFKKLAYQIQHDKSILKESEFNSTKTWIEYINRLIGVLIGFFIIITFYLSIRFFRIDFKLFAFSLLTLILVIIQGWIGSLVVSTNLIPFMVTIHMLIALLIVVLLSWIVIRSNPTFKIDIEESKKAPIVLLLIISIVVLVVQIVLGTQVREAIDMIASSFNFNERSQWISNLGFEFLIHRSFSWLVLLLHILLFYKMYKIKLKSNIFNALILVVLVTILSGTAMAYFDIPAFIQPIHLLLGTLGFGLQIFLFLQLNSKRNQPI